MARFKTQRQRAPLRRVLRREMEDILVDDLHWGHVAKVVAGRRQVEVLECGHRQPILKDHIGETSAYRRRCIACLKEKESKK